MNITRLVSSPRRFFRLLGILSIALALSACGGSDKKAKPVPAPGTAPNVTVSATQPKTLNFSWNAVDYATQYRLLKNEGGNSGYTPVASASAATSATDTIAVHLHDWVNTRYIVEACNQTGCTESAPVYTADAMLAAIGTVRITGAEINDYFGYSIAISGDGSYLAASATNRDLPVVCNEADCSSRVSNAGAVYIFQRGDNGAWTQQAELMITVNASSNDYFGYTLALSSNGDTLAIGTPFEAGAAQGIDAERTEASAPESGAVYVFTRSGSSWEEQSYIKASNAEAYDYFGGSVSLSDDGNTLAVGAQGEASNAKGVNGDQESNSIGVAGAVYLFVRSEGNWSQEAYIKASTQAYLNNECFNPSPVRCLPTHGARFGSSVALAGDGSALAIGAFHEHSNATGVNGNQANFDAPRSGAGYVFVKTESGWQQQAYIKAPNSRAEANFGYRITLNSNGDTLAVSSIKESSQATGVDGDASGTGAAGAGAVYLFSRTDGNWQQSAYVKASNTGTGAEFGSSLALSADGNWLAVGAAKEKGAAAGINGNQADETAAAAGAVYLFRRDGNTWTQHRYIKAPAPVSGDSFGFSLDLDDDGETLAVGAMGTAAPVSGNNLAANAGAVFIY